MFGKQLLKPLGSPCGTVSLGSGPGSVQDRPIPDLSPAKSKARSKAQLSQAAVVSCHIRTPITSNEGNEMTRLHFSELNPTLVSVGRLYLNVGFGLEFEPPPFTSGGR